MHGNFAKAEGYYFNEVNSINPNYKFTWVGYLSKNYLLLSLKSPTGDKTEKP
jgi:hypothetical protein